MCRLRLIRRNQRWSCAGKRNLEHFHWANQNFFSGAARCTTHGKRLFCLWWMQDLYHDTATASGWTILFSSNQSKFLRTGNGYAKDLSTLFSSVCIRRRVKCPAPDGESQNQAGSPIRWFSLIWFVGGEHREPSPWHKAKSPCLAVPCLFIRIQRLSRSCQASDAV